MVIFSLLMLSILVVLWVIARLLWALRRFKFRPTFTGDNVELPTVSVCVPARNEMHALAQCLEYILSSDYEKLEILVLDDSSEDDTSLIIRSFAHAGVRFVPGSALPDGWLGKNHAYKTLAEEASGEYLLFMDVDTLVQPHTISQLVSQLLANKVDMISVLPRREDTARFSAALGTLRYLWEILLAFRDSPPATSALWMIKREILLELDDGFESYAASVRPETHIARYLQKTKQYFYVIGSHLLGVRYEKRWKSQVASSERMYYPMFGHTFFSTMFAAIMVSLLWLPFAMFVYLLFEHEDLALLAAALCVALYVWFGAFTATTYSGKWLVARIALLPYLLLQDTLLLLWSYLRHRTNGVTWKDRKVRAQPLHPSHYSIDE